eukprot:1194841-Prorocentrum_minimum.AAC.1
MGRLHESGVAGVSGSVPTYRGRAHTERTQLSRDGTADSAPVVQSVHTASEVPTTGPYMRLLAASSCRRDTPPACGARMPSPPRPLQAKAYRQGGAVWATRPPPPTPLALPTARANAREPRRRTLQRIITRDPSRRLQVLQKKERIYPARVTMAGGLRGAPR